MTDVSVINAVPATPAKKKFSKVALLKALKFALPVAALAAFFPDTVLASTAGKDLMSSGDATVKGTFGKDSSVVKWVILAEVLVGAVMYDDQEPQVPGGLCDPVRIRHGRYVCRRILISSDSRSEPLPTIKFRFNSECPSRAFTGGLCL